MQKENKKNKKNRFRRNASRKKKTCCIDVTSYIHSNRMRLAVKIDPENDPNDLRAVIDRFTSNDQLLHAFRIPSIGSPIN